MSLDYGIQCCYKALKVTPIHLPLSFLTWSFTLDDTDSPSVSPEESMPSWHDKRHRAQRRHVYKLLSVRANDGADIFE